MDVSPLVWGLTLLFILVLIVGDLVFHREETETTLKEAAWATAGWTSLGLLFTAVVFWLGDGQSASEYFTGYLLERALSVDNVLVFVVILGYFAVPKELEHRALLWGVVGALVLRGVFIALGAALLDRFDWVIYIFGAILLFTAIKLLKHDGGEVHPEKNVVLRMIRRVMPVTHEYEGHKLISRKHVGPKKALTPLAAVLLVLGSTDVLFAVDSVPAVFGVTREPYIVFAANAFSLLGLISMASLLNTIIDRFVYLQQGLAIVLIVVAAKMLAHDFWHPPEWLALVAVVGILAASVALSLLKTRGDTDPNDTIDELREQGPPPATEPEDVK